jgi:8-oxo-dGTP diphosphatase
MGKIIHAVAGVLLDKDQVLISSRPEGKVYAGYWEFPGGKLEVNEDAICAVIRELYEEVGVSVKRQDCEIIARLNQEYEHGLVYLDVVLVRAWIGIAQGIEKQEIFWHNLHNSCLKEPRLVTTDKILNLLKQYIFIT